VKYKNQQVKKRKIILLRKMMSVRCLVSCFGVAASLRVKCDMETQSVEDHLPAESHDEADHAAVYEASNSGSSDINNTVLTREGSESPHIRFAEENDVRFIGESCEIKTKLGAVRDVDGFQRAKIMVNQKNSMAYSGGSGYSEESPFGWNTASDSKIRMASPAGVREGKHDHRTAKVVEANQKWMVDYCDHREFKDSDDEEKRDAKMQYQAMMKLNEEFDFSIDNNDDWTEFSGSEKFQKCLDEQYFRQLSRKLRIPVDNLKLAMYESINESKSFQNLLYAAEELVNRDHAGEFIKFDCASDILEFYQNSQE
jgi:hypothetical protein